MHTVCQTKTFRDAAAAIGMSNEEIDDLIDFIGDDGSVGEIIPNTSGCRRVRYIPEGKTGPVLLVSFLADRQAPIFLINVVRADAPPEIAQK